MKNMANNKHTVVILTDMEDENLNPLKKMENDNNLNTFVREFNNASAIKNLLPEQNNPVCGFSTWRGHQFTCNILNRLCCSGSGHSYLDCCHEVGSLDPLRQHHFPTKGAFKYHITIFDLYIYIYIYYLYIYIYMYYKYI